MKKIIFVSIVVLLLSLSLVNAMTPQEINEAKRLIDSKADCKSLSDSQLEIIGEYYMEQMHPGEAHELMHKMMGLKQGSEAEEQLHINMAKRLYCNEDISGMMGSGSMMSMMGGRMMGSYPQGYGYTNGYWNMFWILLFAATIFLIVWIVYRFGIKKTVSEIPLNILKKRFAKGEITKKEFDDMKKKIGV
ncbi:MAG: SHOCT domain-containing protein [Candidatus Woesearchaeota archaeon]